MTVEQARQLVAPLYDALTRPAEKDGRALLAQICAPDYQSWFTNEIWFSQQQLADHIKKMGATIPDLHWGVEEIFVHGDRIIVRGKATGTPVAPLYGVEPTGKSFSTMAIDIFTVRDGKLASCHHVENWTAAMQQIQQP